jgi:hypothetical protein
MPRTVPASEAATARPPTNARTEAPAGKPPVGSGTLSVSRSSDPQRTSTS